MMNRVVTLVLVALLVTTEVRGAIAVDVSAEAHAQLQSAAKAELQTHAEVQSAAKVELQGTCNIDAGTKLQTIDGFGFSSAWCGTLNAERLNALFSTLGMSILRVRIDENRYWSEETANAKAAHAYGAKVLGSPWSAPPAWTSDGKGAGPDHSLLPSHYGDYAAYLQQAANTIGLDIVSIQNEPDYNSWMNWTPDQMLAFIKNNAGVITTPLMAGESFHFNDQYSDNFLNDAAAVNRVSYVGGHFYGGGNYVHQNALNKGKRVWQTEHYISNSQSLKTSVDVAQTISDAMNNNFHAYIWWWIYPQDTSLDCTLLSPDGRTIYLNGYTIGQWAKFVRPGDKRLSATYHPTSGVSVTAYSGVHSLVIVAVNSNTYAVTQTFSVSNLGVALSSMAVYTTGTSASLGMARQSDVSVSNGVVTVTLPAQSTVTLVGDGGSGPVTTSSCASSAGENAPITLGCATGQVINSVDFASYGTPTGTCASGFTKSTCDATTSVSALQAACVGHSSCTVTASNTVFGDPCPYTGKHLAAQVSCAAASATDNGCGIADEHSTLSLSCAANKRITKINFASYGKPSGSCSAPVTGTCHASTSQAVVEAACLNKNSCSVLADNGVFGDPCSGSVKQLAIVATCA